jgi:hypothetical protein
MHGASPLLSLRGAARRGKSTPSLFCHCEEQRDAAIQPNRNFVIPHFAADWIATSALSGLPRDDKTDFRETRNLA